MEKLSIEEKAKAYDKAREKIAVRFGTNVAEEIFSEFEESEDEKIRKFLIKWIQDNYYHGTTEIPTKTLIAWLEKQGEQKSYGQREECFDCQFNYAGECRGSCAMKRGEQKPFDYENANIQQKDFAPQEDASRYSIGDVLCDKSCTTLDKDAQPNYEIVDIRNGLYICDKGYIPISQQDEYELVAKKIEQKPAWSEEDEEELDIAISTLKEAGQHDSAKWLKSLKERLS